MNDYNSCVEGCNFPSAENDIKILLMQIKREVDELVKTTEAKLLMHDHKIAELCNYIKDNLSNTIRCLVDSMKLSGELDELITEVIDGNIKLLRLHSSEYVNVKEYGAKGDGITDDTEILMQAFKNYKNLYFPKGSYIFNGSMDDASIENMVGDHAEIISTSTAGADYMLKIQNKKHVSIRGMKFNSNHIARGGVFILKSESVDVKDCEFTGYTNKSGYYQTDSCLNVSYCERVNVLNTYFHDTGYELNDSMLNRALTVDNGDLVEINGCKFNKVNQAIVTMNNKTIITNCTFDYVEDNNVYNLRGELIFTNNNVSNRNDEGVVTTGNVNVISNNIFDFVPHSIVIGASMERLIVTNNVFQNVKTKTNKHGVVISARSEEYKIDDLVFKNNTIDIPVQCDGNGQILHFPIVTNLSFTDNIINFYAVNYGRGIYLKDVETLIFTNNFMNDKNNRENANAYAFGVAPRKQVITGNYLGCLRIIVNNAQNLEYVTTNMNPYLQTHNSNKIYTGTCAPVQGTWKRGDVIFNKFASAGGVLGWICVEDGTPGTWKPMGTIQS